MVPTADVIDDVIGSVDPENVPSEYIVMARITTFDGEERILRGAELDKVLKNPENYSIAEARVILNIKKMRKAIADEVDYIYDMVQREFALKAIR